ncbi:MAG: 30S ribosomal protein S13, partial [Thermoplasmata archaeon]
MKIAPKNPKDGEAAAPAPVAPAAESEKSSKKEKPDRTEKGERGEKGEKGAKGKDAKGKGGKPGAPGASAKKSKPIPDNPNFRYIVRVAGSDLDGRRPVALALTGVRGVGLRIAEVACRFSSVDAREMIGNLPEATVEGLETTLGHITERLPPWMVNHPSDRTTGEIRHFIGPDLETARRDDLNQMRMIRSYRGVRHERGQKVRGQRTRSNGRTGMAAGVLKKAAKEAAQAKGKEAAPAAAASPAAG